MYSFRDNWVGDIHRFETLREAKKNARKHTCGYPVVIYGNRGEIVRIVNPKEDERPLP